MIQIPSEVFVPALSTFIAMCVWILSWSTRYFRVVPIGFGKNIWLGMFAYIRPVVYATGLLWATFLFVNVAQNTGSSVAVSLSVLMRQFALTGLYLLFITLIPGLLSVYFPALSFNALFVRARRALGVSGFYFGAVHGLIGFIYNLSASIFSPLFLPLRYQIALLCSFVAFCILALMAASSIDRVESWLGPVKWKRLHRCVYWAIILIVIHAFMIGSHFTTPQAPIPMMTNVIALTLLLLEIGATVLRLWQQKRIRTKQGAWTCATLCILLIGGYWATQSVFQKTYDPHGAHRKGYSKNYIAEVVTSPSEILPNKPVTARIEIRDKRNNQVVKKFQLVQEKFMHLMVIGRDLATYQHLHPELQPDGTFLVTFTLPKEGAYTLYIGYSPPDFLENLSIKTLKTQNAPKDELVQIQVDERTKIIKDTSVTLSPTGVLPLIDTVDFSYIFKDIETGAPISDIEPYLGAFGHLAIVSEDGQTYTHVHPIDIPISQAQLGGPQVRFSTFFQKQGKYKLFGQFKRKGEVFVTEFVVEVK